VGRATDGYSGTAINSTYERAEAAVRLGDLWLGGGLVRRDSAYARSLSLFDSTYAAVALPSATGMTVTARGRVWKDVGMDAWAVRWTDTAGLYRPQYQARSELYVRTRWLSRFPTGDFGLYFGVTHEYRSSLFVPVASGNAATIERVPGYRVWSTLLEIRILRAVAFWQMRNPLNAIYYQVPGFMQPRTTQSYGVRWEFWD
jgi:hypothetical protein